MTFPVSPVDGEKANVNGVTYTFSSSLDAFTVTSNFLDTFTGNALIANSAIIAGDLNASTVTVNLISASGNITGGNFDTAGSVTATGNITCGNFDTAGSVTATGNITGGNFDTAGSVTATGNITGGNLSGTNIVGTLSTASQPNITQVGSLGNTQISSLGVGTAASGNVGEIRATDNITAYFSDRRLKEITGTIPDAIDKVMSLSGVQFTNNDRAAEFGYTSQHPQVGVVAQEVQRVLPEAVVAAPFDIATDADGKEISRTGQNYLTVQYEKIIPLLIEAIKQQQFMIQELQQRVD